MRHASGKKRAGLSLLEVLLALGIFMLSTIVINQMVESGAQRGRRSQLLTRAALLCEAKMDEIVAGAQPLQSTGQMPLESGEPNWTYAVAVEPESWSNAQINGQSLAGLNTVHVTVAWISPQTGETVEYTLSRQVLDPRLRVPEPLISQQTPSQETTQGSSQGGTRRP